MYTLDWRNSASPIFTQDLKAGRSATQTPPLSMPMCSRPSRSSANVRASNGQPFARPKFVTTPLWMRATPASDMPVQIAPRESSKTG